MELLRDPIWQFIGALLALAGIVAGVRIYQLQRKEKKLSYEVLVDNELLTSSEELQGKIRIFFGKKTVQNVHLLIVKITNDGDIPIAPSDFYEALTFLFSDTTKLLSVEVTECYPISLKVEVQHNNNCVFISPVLLNNGDFFTLKLMLSQYDGNLKVTSRIIGVDSIQDTKASELSGRNRKLLTISTIFIAIGILSLILVIGFSIVSAINTGELWSLSPKEPLPASFDGWPPIKTESRIIFRHINIFYFGRSIHT